MSSISTRLQSNLQRIQDRIVKACDRSGREPGDVTLVAVTKYADLDWVRCLVDLGVSDLGESRPQQIAERSRLLPGHIRWHLIGHLQRNKVELVLPVCNRIHSVDSMRLLQALVKECEKRSAKATGDPVSPQEGAQRPRILIEVNVSGESSKDGFDPEELIRVWPVVHQLPGLSIEGLMTMAPQSDDPELSRLPFRRLRELRDRLSNEAQGVKFPDLSMGMSGDFEIGIEEGATLIRIGSSLFEGLTSS